MARILILTNWFPPHHSGGYEIVCQDVATRLVDKGHQVEVLCSDRRMELPVAAVEPLPVHRDLKMYWKDDAPWRPPLATQLTIERHNHQVLIDHLDTIRPDVVNVWHMAGLSMNLLTTLQDRAIPIVYAIHDDWLLFAPKLDPWSSRWQRSPLHRMAGRALARPLGVPTVVSDLSTSGCFCFVSAATLGHARLGSPWRLPLASVVHAGIDPTLFPPPEDVTAKTGWNWRLLYVGRVDRRKGIDTVLQAMSRWPSESTLSVMGRSEGGEAERLQQMCHVLGLTDRVRFGQLNRGELRAAYAAADCVIFPSTWPEPFGLVPLEAMACGTPVVATAMGGSAEFLIDESNCLIFPAGDSPALGEAVCRLARDPVLRQQLTKQGLVTASGFDVARMAEAYDRYLTAAAEGRLGSLNEWHTPTQASQPALRAAAARREVAPLLTEGLRGVRGPVLCVGDGANPDILANSGPFEGTVVSMATASGAHGGAIGLRVVARYENLPFRTGAFDAVVSQNALEQSEADAAAAAELARVARPGARILMVASNRHAAETAWPRVRDRWRGWHRDRSFYFATDRNRREYSWREFNSLLASSFSITSDTAVGWSGTARGRLASHLLRGPLRKLSRAVLVTATPKESDAS